MMMAVMPLALNAPIKTYFPLVLLQFILYFLPNQVNRIIRRKQKILFKIILDKFSALYSYYS